MGSSKKHKEKRERKKHKKGRSRSRERDGSKKAHKSSHRSREKKHSFESGDDNENQLLDRRQRTEGSTSAHENHEDRSRIPQAANLPREISPDLDLDIDQLLDSKLSEKSELPDVKKSVKKRRREFIEEFKRLHNEGKHDSSMPVKIKEEPVDSYRDHPPLEGRSEPQLSLSINETNKLRAKLGLKPLDVEEEKPERSEPQLSLTVNETNKLRAKLGLKPLDVGEQIPGLSEDLGKSDTKTTEVFVKTENIAEKKRAEQLREKLKVSKEKRKIEDKLRKAKTVANSDSEEESAADWVKKHQKILEEKKRAEMRAKLLEEMDAEFGIGVLVEEEFEKKKAYTSNNLKGLTVSHDVESFREGQNVILTLKDKDVLNEDEDVLENVNILDDERHAKNVENRKNKPDYRPYEEPEFDEFGILKKKNLLSKYDEEIDGEKKKTFKIGSSNPAAFVSKEQELELIRMKLKQQNEVTLEMPQMKIANEYYASDELVQFKKPKKKIRKIRKLRADDLLPNVADDVNRDFGSRNMLKMEAMEVDSYENSQSNFINVLSGNEIPFIGADMSENLSNEVVDEEQAEKDLHHALNKARRLKKRIIEATAPEKVLKILNSANEGGPNAKKDPKAPAIELNSVAEFCRTLGEIPTYGMAGNREEEAEEMMDLDKDMLDDQEEQDPEGQNRGAWNEVDIDEKPAEILMRENEPILEEEPDISLGVAGALKLAMKKGYLDKDDQKLSTAPRSSQLQAQSYTIEEKFYEDDKFGKRDRYTGPVQEFREKSNYKPDVKLEYIDDSGRLLNSKEAFRYLSHKFHGKGPGKNKVDKRMKKLDQDTRLKQMSSTDTPLNTVKLLQLKQKETQSPYIVLSGGNKTLTQTMISKSKPI